MLKVILRRLLVLIPVLLLVTMLISSLIYFSPGDPVRVMLGIRANEEAVAAIRSELGLDKPYYLRYLSWLGNAVQGTLGRSLKRNEKVSDLIAERLPATLESDVRASGLISCQSSNQVITTPSICAGNTLNPLRPCGPVSP